jgi:hypothetical protein
MLGKIAALARQMIQQFITILLVRVGLTKALTLEEKIKIVQDKLRSSANYKEAWPKFHEIMEIVHDEEGQLVLKCGADVTISQAYKTLVICGSNV